MKYLPISAAVMAALFNTANVYAADVDETMVISGSRVSQHINDVPRSMTVISSNEIKEMLTYQKDFSSVLSQLVPGMGTSIHGNLTSKGQNNIRGRRVLLLVDGVSQNNGFLDFGQEMLAIDPENIERVEVIRGGSAVYGIGAQGGIINVITKTPRKGKPSFKTKIGTNFQPNGGDSLGYSLYQSAQGGDDTNQWHIGLGAKHNGGSYGADGKRLPSKATSDDMNDFNLNSMFNHNIDGDRSLTFNLSARQAQDHDGWCSANGLSEDGKHDGTAYRCGAGISDNVMNPITGELPKDVQRSPVKRRFINTKLRYQDMDFALGMLDVSGYYMSQKGRTATLKYRIKDTSSPFHGKDVYGNNFTDFQKYGLKANVTSDFDWAQMTWGVDIEQQQYQQPNTAGLRNITPDVGQFTLATFAQFNSDLTDSTKLSYGARIEGSQLQVSDFTTSEVYGNHFVKGGTPSFVEPLFNVGVVQELSDDHSLFASFAQGMSTNEVLRDIRTGQNGLLKSVDGALRPVKTDNYEMGFRGFIGEASYSVAGFYSQSDLGATLEINQDGTRLESVRAPERVWGVETTLNYRFTDNLSSQNTFSWQDGERQLKDKPWEPLDGTRIAPIKLTSMWQYQTNGFGNYNLSMIYSGKRDRSQDISRGALFPVDEFFLASIGANYDVGVGTLHVGVENLFNELYITPYNQSQMSTYRYHYAPGRRFFVSYEVKY